MSKNIEQAASRHLFSQPAITIIIGLLLLLSPFRLQTEILSLRITPSSLFIWLLLLWGFWQIVYQKGVFRYTRIPFFRLWVLYVILVLVGFSLGEGNLRNPLQAIWSLFRNIEILLLYPIVVQIATNFHARRWMVTALMLGICVSALFGIVQSVSNGRWLSGLSENGNGRYLGLFQKEEVDFRRRFVIDSWNRNTPFFRAHGTVDSPNQFAALMNVGIALSVGALIARSRKHLLWVLVLILTGAALFFSLSRAGLAAISVAVIFAWLSTAKLRLSFIKKSLAFAAFVLTIAVLALLFLPETIKQRFSGFFNLQENSEVVSRQEVWSIAWQRIRAQPITGYGNDRIPSTLLQRWGDQIPDISPHNTYLAAAHQYGIMFAIVMIIWLMVLLYTGYHLSKSMHAFDRKLGMGLMIFSWGIIIHSFFDSILQHPSMQILLWGLLGVATTTYAGLRYESKNAERNKSVEHYGTSLKQI